MKSDNDQTPRIGHGYDRHRLVEGRRLVLGGVVIPYARGLDGHSDADVVVHAICDALLGAAALGDIGRHNTARTGWTDGRRTRTPGGEYRCYRDT